MPRCRSAALFESAVYTKKHGTQKGAVLLVRMTGLDLHFLPMAENRCSPPSSRRRKRSSTPHLNLFESFTLRNKQIIRTHLIGFGLYCFGAADGTRTRTVSLPGDFKSPVSTDSTTAAAIDYDNTIFKFRQVTAGPDSAHRHPGSNPETSSAPADPWPSWPPRSASPRNRTPYCLPSALPDT